MNGEVKLGMDVQLHHTTRPDVPLGRVVGIIKRPGAGYMPGELVVRRPDGSTMKVHKAWVERFYPPRIRVNTSWGYFEGPLDQLKGLPC